MAGKHGNIAIFIPHLGCEHACSFCNQRIISGNETPMDVKTAQKVIVSAYEAMDAERRSRTEIAFFGGSFTAIPKQEMISYLEICTPFLGEGGFMGIRISTRPDAIDEEILDILGTYGVTAIELGAQSLDDKVLSLNERGHTAKDCIDAVRLIQKSAYRFSLGLQMMVGLYGESKESLYATAEQILALRPDTLRIYPVVILRGTKLDALYQSGEYRPISLGEAVEYTAYWMEQFKDAGIRLIKVGLHASKEVEEQMTGGLYHPAFCELCEGMIYRNRMQKMLDGKEPGNYRFTVKQSDLSKAIGQKKSNLQYFAAVGYRITVTGGQAEEMTLERIQDR